MDDIYLCWQSYDAWVAYFDLLGFKEKLKTRHVARLQEEVTDIVRDFQTEANEFKENVDYLFYADTFIFYSRSGESKDFPGLLHVATHFIEKCISKGRALRGALSFGKVAIGHGKRIMLGTAFLDGYKFGEDQNWLGLILTPSAASKVKEIGLDPSRLKFINCDIPKRERSINNDDNAAYAYTFCRGVKNFPLPLLAKLREMQKLLPEDAPEDVEDKYQNTITFIEKHDWVDSNLGTLSDR
jgi:hypothetical protein